MSFPRIPRWSAVRHKVYVRAFSGVAPYYLVNEFPKSGGTWLAQMLADALGLPFRRNAPIRFERSVTHGHFLAPIGLRNTVVIWRDPRDLLISLYYHSYFINEHDNTALVQFTKERCPFDDYHDIRKNLPEFIRFRSNELVHRRLTWPRFAHVWARRPGTVHTSYEKLRADTETELARIAETLTGMALSADRAEEVAEAHSFGRVKEAAERNRPDYAEISFVREGSIGGWRKNFTDDAEAALRECGYVPPMRFLDYTAW